MPVEFPDLQEDLETRNLSFGNLYCYATKCSLEEPPLRDLLARSSRGSVMMYYLLRPQVMVIGAWIVRALYHKRRIIRNPEKQHWHLFKLNPYLNPEYPTF